MRAVVLILFYCSGAIGLIYEVCWVRAMSLHMGATSIATATVLAVFMGGLALGAAIARKPADRAQNPLVVYGILELLLGLYGALTPLLLRGALGAFEQIAQQLSDGTLTLALVRLGVAAIVLVPPAAIMGATLPVLTRHWAMNTTDASRGAGLLYALNTLGAFVGVLFAGMYLLPRIGLQATILVAAGANLVIGATAIAMGRFARTTAQTRAVGTTAPDAQPAKVPWTLLGAVMLTGFSALTCEVAWTRLLVLLLGASVYAFTIMLATFLTGLGLGAAVVSFFLDETARARRWFYALALASAASLILSAWSFSSLPWLFARLFHSWNLADRPGTIIQVQFLFCALVMLVPALLMGALLPLAIRVVRDERHTPRAVAAIYSWNTLGAIAGSIATGFVLLPRLGVIGSIRGAAVLQCLAAVMVLASRAPIPLSLAGLVVLASLLALPGWNRSLMNSAMYHYAELFAADSPGALRHTLEERYDLLFYRDGLSATVGVQIDQHSPTLTQALTVNGKVDGTSQGDMPTQRLIAHIPLLVHDAPRDVCVIGLGTGCTAGSAALHDRVEAVTVAEIEGAVIEAAELFVADNHGVHDHPKVTIAETDGRLLLRQNPGAFDVVISEPSNPWQAGNADLFTTEYLRLARRALREGGIFCQWIQLYKLSPENVHTLARTVLDVFPNTMVFMGLRGTDLVIVASESALSLDLEKLDARLGEPDVAEDLADDRVRVVSREDLLARYWFDDKAFRALAGEGDLHTDDLPVIAYRAPLDLNLRFRAASVTQSPLRADALARQAALWLQVLRENERDSFLETLDDAMTRFDRRAPSVRAILAGPESADGRVGIDADDPPTESEESQSANR